MTIDKLENLGLRKLAIMVLEKDERIIDLEDETERLNNIIKEVREYIEQKEVLVIYQELGLQQTNAKEELLEILDKENK